MTPDLPEAPGGFGGIAAIVPEAPGGFRGFPKSCPSLGDDFGDSPNPAAASETIWGIAKIVTTKRDSLHKDGEERLGPSVKLLKTNGLSDS